MRNFAATDQSQAAMGRRRSVQTGTGQFALRMSAWISVLGMRNFAATDQSQVVKRKCVQTGTGQFVLRMNAKKLTTISVITVIRILVKWFVDLSLCGNNQIKDLLTRISAPNKFYTVLLYSLNTNRVVYIAGCEPCWAAGSWWQVSTDLSTGPDRVCSRGCWAPSSHTRQSPSILPPPSTMTTAATPSQCRPPTSQCPRWTSP